MENNQTNQIKAKTETNKTEIIRNLTKSRKTGGLRKKVNSKRLKKEAKQNKFKKDFTTVLTKINNCIRESYIDNNTNDLVNYLNQSLVLIYAQLRPQELNRKSKDIKNIKKLRSNWINIRSLIIKKVDNTETEYVFRESFTFYTKNLSDYGLQYISICYGRLYDGLLNKVYALPPTEEQKPDEDELNLSKKRLDLEHVKLNELTKEVLHKKYLEKSLEYHMDTPSAIREREKYEILRKRIRKALISLELYLDFLI